MFNILVFNVNDPEVQIASFTSNIMPSVGQNWSATPGGQVWTINSVVFSPDNTISVFIL